MDHDAGMNPILGHGNEYIDCARAFSKQDKPPRDQIVLLGSLITLLGRGMTASRDRNDLF
jgi:hypothetical protein